MIALLTALVTRCSHGTAGLDSSYSHFAFEKYEYWSLILPEIYQHNSLSQTGPFEPWHVSLHSVQDFTCWPRQLGVILCFGNMSVCVFFCLALH